MIKETFNEISHNLWSFQETIPETLFAESSYSYLSLKLEMLTIIEYYVDHEM